MFVQVAELLWDFQEKAGKRVGKFKADSDEIRNLGSLEKADEDLHRARELHSFYHEQRATPQSSMQHSPVPDRLNEAFNGVGKLVISLSDKRMRADATSHVQNRSARLELDEATKEGPDRRSARGVSRESRECSVRL